MAKVRHRKFHMPAQRVFPIVGIGASAGGLEALGAFLQQIPVGSVTFVQSPASAKFTGMPLSAIRADVADVVAPPKQLPAEIVAYLQRRFLISLPKLELKDRSRGGNSETIGAATNLFAPLSGNRKCA